MAAVGVDVDAKGSGLCEDETHFSIDARVESRACVSKTFGILVGLRWRAEEAAIFLGFPMSLQEKKALKFAVKVPRGARHPGHKGCAIVIAVCGLRFSDFSACCYL